MNTLSAPQTADAIHKPTPKDWGALAVLASGLGLIVLDGTIVGVALPDIIRSIDLNLTDAQWVNSIYAVLLAALLLSTGKIADRVGRKRLFLLGLVIFALGSGLAALSGSAAPLIASRAVQAVGAAMIMPSTLSTVNATFRGKYRAAAFGVWGAVISGAAAIGPLAGGALTQFASWHWIFLVNLPLCLIVLIVGFFTVTETNAPSDLPGFDVDGAQLSAIGFGTLVFGIIEGPELGWWSQKAPLTIGPWTWLESAPISPVPTALIVSAIALALFVRWEIHRERVQRSRLLELSLFGLPTFSWGNLTAAMVAIGEFAIIFVLPLYLINVLGLSVLNTGFVLAAMAVGAFASGAAARHLAAKFGAPGTVLIGLGLEMVGAVWLALTVSGEGSGWMAAAPLVLYGLGLGLASAQLTGTVLQDAPVEVSGQASATQSTVRQIGSALGTAVAGATLSVALANSLPKALENANLTGEVADSFAESTRQTAGTTIAILRGQGGHSPFGGATDTAIRALSDGFASATQVSLFVAAGFLMLGFIGALRVLQVSRDPNRPGAGGAAKPQDTPQNAKE